MGVDRRANLRSNPSYHRRTGGERIGTARCAGCGEQFALWRRWQGKGWRYSGFDRLLGHQIQQHGGVVGFRVACLPSATAARRSDAERVA